MSESMRCPIDRPVFSCDDPDMCVAREECVLAFEPLPAEFIRAYEASLEVER